MAIGETYGVKNKYIQALLAEGMNTSPIQSPWQGASRMAHALLGGLAMGKEEQKEEAFRKALAASLAGDEGGGAAPVPSLYPQQQAPQAAPRPAAAPGPMGALSQPQASQGAPQQPMQPMDPNKLPVRNLTDPRVTQLGVSVENLPQPPAPRPAGLNAAQLGNLPMPVLRQLAVEKLKSQMGTTGDLREYKFAVDQGYKGTLAEWFALKRSGGGEYGMTPVWGRGPDNKPALIQLGKSGKPIQPELPPGFEIARDPIKIDAGTHFEIRDPQNPDRILSIIPKNIAEAKRQEKVGGGQGDATEALTSMKSKMPGLEKVVAQLDTLSERATYTIAGQTVDFARRQTGAEPREAAIARQQYISMVDNQILPLLRDTFGAQFTEREGATLRATLGNPDLSPKEKQAVLKAFIEQKRRDVEALESRVGGTSAPAQQQPIRRFNPATGRIE